jgi:hypothetical protein
MKIFTSKFAKIPKHSTFSYEPRYVQETEKPIEQRIQFRKGILLERSNTLAKHRSPIFSHKEKLSTSRKWSMLMLIGGQFASAYYWFKNMDRGWAHLVFPLIFLLVLLILFIRENNRR